MRAIIRTLVVGICAATIVCLHKANTNAMLGFPARITVLDAVNSVRYFSDRQIMRDAMNYAVSEAAKRYPHEDPDCNGLRNAYKHVCWAAILTAELRDEKARNITSGHESFRGNPPLEKAMDLFNNDVGHKLGSQYPTAEWSELADLGQKHLTAGDLLIIENGRLQASNDQPTVMPVNRRCEKQSERKR
jgi:hypothetical protein